MRSQGITSAPERKAYRGGVFSRRRVLQSHRRCEGRLLVVVVVVVVKVVVVVVVKPVGYSTNQKPDAKRLLINIFVKVCITHQGASNSTIVHFHMSETEVWGSSRRSSSSSSKG